MFCLFGVTPGLAQRVLTLDDCLATAYRQHPSLRIAESNSRTGEFAREEMEQNVLPKVKVGGSATYAPHGNQQGYDPVVTDGGQVSAQLSVSQQVYDGGTRGLRTDQLSLDLGRLRGEERLAARDLRFNVSSSFYEVLEAEQALGVHQRRLEDLSNYADLVNRMFHGGGIKYTDVLRTKISLENEQTSFLKAQQAFASARISLAEAIGTPDDTSFTVSTAADAPAGTSIDSLIHSTQSDTVENLDITLAGYNVRRSLIEVDIARAERSPAIVLNGDVGYLSSFDNYRLPHEERIRPFGGSIGVNIEHPLLSWGISDLRIQQRELDAQVQQLALKQQRQVVLAERKRIRGSIISSLDQMRSLGRTLSTAEDHYALCKAQYAGGGITALEVLSAEQLLADVREGLLQTRTDLWKLLARFEQLSTQ